MPEAIERARQVDILNVAERQFGAKLRKVTPTEWVGPCPKCGGTDRFSINTSKQIFNCRGCRAGGDAIALVRHVFGIPFEDALERINGEPIKPARTTPEAEDETFVSPVPASAPPAPAEHPRLGKPTGWWTYLTDKGGLESHVMRFDLPDGSKQFRPLTLWCGPEGLRWRWRGVPAPRRLYGHDRLAAHTGASVLICEGEKAADAAQRIFPDFVAVSSPNGAKAVDQADWTPLEGREIVIWPDHDDEGAHYARRVAEILLGLGCRVSVVDAAMLIEIGGGDPKPERKVQGWDAADAINEWIDISALRENALELARPFAESAEAAEDISDPFDDLLDRLAADRSAAFSPEILKRLAALKKEDRHAFESLRSQVKKFCNVAELDDAIAMENGDAGGRGPTQASILIDIAESAALFHAPDGTGFADLDISGHRETWPIRSKGFRRWLARRFFEMTRGAPSSEAFQSVLSVIEARAQFGAPERIVRIRVSGMNGKLYLDLADEKWRAVEIDDAGWRPVDNPPARFCRRSGMKPLPVPTSGGSIESLRSFLNVRSDADFILVVGWALGVLRDRGPYPALVLSGEQGSAKSTAAAILRALLDPNTAPLRALPREDRDLFIAASNSHVLAFDNVSGLPHWISDTLCRLATGGGFAVRQLYTDQDEVLFDAARPLILNGIEDIVTRPDLADRAMFLALEPIPDGRRRPEADLWAAFEKERPGILGALLDAVAEGLRNLPKVRPARLPRMADFALWASACEPAFWPSGRFGSAYSDNLEEAVATLVDDDRVASAVREFMAPRSEWTGTATELLKSLPGEVSDQIAKSKDWPQNARALSGSVRRLAPALRKMGIDLTFPRGKDRKRTRTIVIRTLSTPNEEASQPYASAAEGSEGKFASAPSASSAPTSNRNDTNGLGAASARTVVRTVVDAADGRDDQSDDTVRHTVRHNSLNSNDRTVADGADANFPSAPAPEKNSNPGWRARL
jgi:hypothetical protein